MAKVKSIFAIFFISNLCASSIFAAAYEYTGTDALPATTAADDTYTFIGSASANFNMGGLNVTQTVGTFINQSTSASSNWSLYWGNSSSAIGCTTITALENKASNGSKITLRGGSTNNKGFKIVLGDITMENSGIITFGDGNGAPSDLEITGTINHSSTKALTINLGKAGQYNGTLLAGSSTTNMSKGSIEVINTNTGADATFGTVNFAADTTLNFTVGSSDKKFTTVALGDITLKTGATGNIMTNVNLYTDEAAGASINSLKFLAGNTNNNHIILTSNKEIRILNNIDVENDNAKYSKFTSNVDVIVSGTLNISSSFELKDTKNLIVAGIVGSVANHAYRIGTTSTGTTASTLTITNNTSTALTHSFLGRLHDYSASDTVLPTDASILNLVMDSSKDFVQYLSGCNYYRGTTTIKSGTLHMRADGKDYNGKSEGSPAPATGLGIGKLIMEGGAFSACGSPNSANTEVGLVKTTSLDWSGGNIIVDFAGLLSDKIEVSGAFTNVTSDTKTFFFNTANIMAGVDYEILSFAETNFSSEDDFAHLFDDDTKYTATFKLDANSLSVNFTAIPEASAYAGIFGLVALAIVIRRRVRK